MATLTISFSGVLDEALDALVSRGFAKTKSEAIRVALLHYAEEKGVTGGELRARAEDYFYDEAKKRMKRR